MVCPPPLFQVSAGVDLLAFADIVAELLLTPCWQRQKHHRTSKNGLANPPVRARHQAEPGHCRAIHLSGACQLRVARRQCTNERHAGCTAPEQVMNALAGMAKLTDDLRKTIADNDVNKASDSYLFHSSGEQRIEVVAAVLSAFQPRNSCAACGTATQPRRHLVVHPPLRAR